MSKNTIHQFITEVIGQLIISEQPVHHWMAAVTILFTSSEITLNSLYSIWLLLILAACQHSNDVTP